MKKLLSKAISSILTIAVLSSAFFVNTVVSTAIIYLPVSPAAGSVKLSSSVSVVTTSQAYAVKIDSVTTQNPTSEIGNGYAYISFSCNSNYVSGNRYAIGYARLDDSANVTTGSDASVATYSNFNAIFPFASNSSWSQINHPATGSPLTGSTLKTLTAESLGITANLALSPGKYAVGIIAHNNSTPDSATYLAATAKYIVIEPFVKNGGDTPTTPTTPNIVYEYYMENFNGGSAYGLATGTTLWVSGGKTTFENGAVYDGKTSLIQVFEVADQKYQNISNAKSTQWGIFASNAPAQASNYKISPDGDKDVVKISKGRITAGKKTGTAYAQAVVGINKNTGSNGVSAGAVAVTTKQAATAIQIFDTPSSSSDRMAIKAVSAPVNIPAKVYADGVYKADSGFASADPDNTYNVIVDPKYSDYVQLSVSDDADSYTDSLPALTAAEINNGIYIKGVKLAENGKSVKAAVIIQNIQSGKKSKLTVNVDNSVVTVMDTGSVITIERNSEEAKSGATVAMQGKYYQAALATEATTDKGKACIMTKANYDSTIAKGNYAQIIDENGKIKFDSALKLDGISVGYKNDIAEVKVKKGKAPSANTSYMVLVVFNTNKDSDGKYVGVIPVQFDITSGSDDTDDTEETEETDEPTTP